MSRFNLSTKNLLNSPAPQSISNIALAVIIQIGEVLISSYKTQLLLLLSQSKIVGLEYSPDWGVLLPESNGQVSLISGELIEVVVPRTSLSAEVKFDKQLWKLTELKLLDPEVLLTKLRSDIAIIVLAKIVTEKKVSELVEKLRKTKTLYESLKSYQDCTDKYNEWYLHQLEAVIQLKNLQIVQTERIGKLLLVLDFVNSEKENVIANFDCHQVVEKEAGQKRLGLVDFVEKFTSLDSTNIS